MSNITTLIPDIYQLLKEKQGTAAAGWFTDELAIELSRDLGVRLKGSFGPRQRKGTLRLSQMGPRCPKALWYALHHPERAEKVNPWTQIKFAYGHILEALIIPLAKASGHEVTGEQDALVLDDIVGHRDAVIDGVTVDIKSASSLSFQKFKAPNYAVHDSFGYLDQIDGYVMAAHSDPLVRDKHWGCLLAIEKQQGHLCLYKHHVTDQRKENLRERIKYYKEIQAMDTPPPCECKTQVGAWGNIELNWKAGYNEYKWECFPGLRACKYAGGVTFLAKVNKWPRGKDGRPLPEFNREGETIYH